MIPVEKFLLPASASLAETLDVLGMTFSSVHGSGFALVLGANGTLRGVISDADFRRFVAETGELPRVASEIAREDFLWFEAGESKESWERKLVAEVIARGWTTEIPIKFAPVLRGGVPVGVEEISIERYSLTKRLLRVVVVGLGFVGLTLACVSARKGFETVGIEKESSKRALLAKGEDYLGEPGLLELLAEHSGKHLTFASELGNLVDLPPGRKNIYIICVGTPLGVDNEANLADFLNVINDLSLKIRQGDVLILRSTLPVGTTRAVAKLVEDSTNLRVGQDFFVASAPERTVEGNAVKEISTLPQLVGGVTEVCTEQASEFFDDIADAVVIMQNAEAAELAKLASNAFRDYHFAFANYISRIARKEGLDINKLIYNANMGYPRNAIPKPSPGVGGPCLSKDSWILAQTLQEKNSLLKEARLENARTPAFVVEYLTLRLETHAVDGILGLGLAFKGIPETTDLRGSPGVEILKLLADAGYKIAGIDAVASVPDSWKWNENVFAKPEGLLVLNNHSMNNEVIRQLAIDGTLNQLKVVFDPWEIVSRETVALLRTNSTIPEMIYLSHIEVPVLESE